jgi:tripartite-type tricarboxylate transporter receptor subunit TctC
VPTVSESGVKGYEAATWNGIQAPEGTPAPIVRKLSDNIKAALAEEEISARLLASGFEPAPAMAPAEFGAYIKTEIRKWSSLIRNLRIQLD